MENLKQIKQNLKYPSFSIIIEWENTLQTDERWLARVMLQRLCKQILQILEKISKAEIIIVYDPKEIERSAVEKFVLKPLSPCMSVINLKLIPAQRLHYYEMKNLGAKNNSNDLILFTDSDVIPDDGWLVGFLDSFERDDVHVIGGNTYIALDNLLKRIFALVWFMPLPDVDHIYEKLHFSANNVAFRRKIFDAHQFPNLAQFHGQCDALISELISSNIKIYRQPKCKVSHPMPETIRQFVTWSLSLGLDFAARRRALKVKDRSNSEIIDERGSIHQMISRTRKRLQYVGLSPTVFFGACGILPPYFVIMFFGIILAAFQPNYYNFIRKKKWRMWT